MSAAIISRPRLFPSGFGLLRSMAMVEGVPDAQCSSLWRFRLAPHTCCGAPRKSLATHRPSRSAFCGDAAYEAARTRIGGQNRVSNVENSEQCCHHCKLQEFQHALRGSEGGGHET